MEMPTKQKPSFIRAFRLLLLSILLIGGGLFIWQNQFVLSLFSSAKETKVSTIIVLGDTLSAISSTDQGVDPYSKIVKKALEQRLEMPMTYINKADKSDVGTTSLRYQAVLGYGDIPQPSSGKIIFLVTSGYMNISKGLASNDAVHDIVVDVRKNLLDLVELTTSKPGVFADGYVIYVANVIDPLDGTGLTSACKGTFPNATKDQIFAAISQVNAEIQNFEDKYPEVVHVVNANGAFYGHGIVAAEDLWMKNCTTLNENGQAQLGKLFVQKILENTNY